MTYQRNMLPLFQEDVLNDALPDQIVGVQIDADDDTGDEHDDHTLDQLVLTRPLDLLQLRPRLGDEPPRPAPRDRARLDPARRRGLSFGLRPRTARGRGGP